MPAAAPDGLLHLGVLYDDPDDLAARLLPEIRAVLDGGGEVRATVERSGVRALREALGGDVDGVTFPPPGEGFSAGAPDAVARLRRELPRDRRTLLVAQYPTSTPPAWDSAFAEDAVDLVFADLPVTVVCACPRDGTPTQRALTERAHQELLDVGGRVANASYRAPEVIQPAPLDAAWGPPAARLTVRGGEGLAELRRCVVSVAAEAGLVGDARDAAVLAAHEAVLLAAGVDTDAEQCPVGAVAVEVRTAGGAVLTEVRSPLSRDAGCTWRRELLPSFCDVLATHRGDADECVVRVVSGG